MFQIVRSLACVRRKPQQVGALHRALFFNMAAVTSFSASAFLTMSFNFATNLSTSALVSMA